MRLTILILFLFTIKANATVYYVSNTGDDNNMGTSICESWRTLSKVNAYSLFADNDSILFKANDIWNEKLIVHHSNLYFGRYGVGIDPLLTGFKFQEGFVQTGVNTWSLIVDNSVKVLNTIMLNGKFAFKARYPNSGWLATAGQLRNDYITTALPNTDNYVGAEAVVRTKNWILDVRKVTAQTSNTLMLDRKLSFNIMYQSRFFFQNVSKFIDSVGEFSFDSSNKRLCVYSVSTPVVQVSCIDTLVLINHKDNVTFDNISFTGANMYTLKVDTSHNLTVKNCSINYAGNFGVYASKSRNIVIDDNTIENCYNVGLLIGFHRKDILGIFVDSCRNATITNNVIKNIGTIAGMASNGLLIGDGERTNIGIFLAGDYAVIRNNRVDSTGGLGIKVHGAMDSIYYNYITNFAFNKCDLGGLETHQAGVSADYNKGMVMYRNIIGYGIGCADIITTNYAPGIYLDQYVNGITIKENTVFSCKAMSLYLLQDSNVTIRDNNLESSYISSSKNINLYGNAFYQPDKASLVLYCPIASIKYSDSNYFLRPLYPNNMLSYAGKTYSFPHLWVDSTGFDIHSKGTPTSVISNIGKLYINPTLIDSTINVNGTFVDARGNIIVNTFTLQPYTSITIFPSSSYIPIAKIKKQ